MKTAKRLVCFPAEETGLSIVGYHVGRITSLMGFGKRSHIGQQTRVEVVSAGARV